MIRVRVEAVRNINSAADARLLNSSEIVMKGIFEGIPFYLERRLSKYAEAYLNILCEVTGFCLVKC